MSSLDPLRDVQISRDLYDDPAAAASAGERRRRWLTLTGLGLVIALAATVFAFGLGRDPNLLRSPLVGRAAPAFSLPTVDGDGTIQLSDFRGQVVVINFWASWCAPCRTEHPALMTAWARYRDQGVVFVGIHFQDTTANALTYRAELGGDWPLLSDAGTRTALDYGVVGIPETFFIGPDGTVAYKHTGPVTYPLLVDQISHLLNGRRP
jgi:cytochrome c biogenesis protein CcmG, thiol:disulfide interchange protein DsbE